MIELLLTDDKRPDDIESPAGRWISFSSFPIFALIVVGALAKRLRTIGEPDFSGLRDIAFFMAIPALLFAAIVKGPHLDLLEVTGLYFAASLTVFAAAKAMGRSIAAAAMLGLNASFGNTVMLGIPIVAANLGRDALPPLLAIIGLHSAILLPLAELGGGDHQSVRRFLTTAVLRVLRNPIIVSILAAFVWRWLALPFPQWLQDLLAPLGAAAPALALICLGGTLPAPSWKVINAEVVLAAAETRRAAGTRLGLCAPC